MLLSQAREHEVKLVLLWFATWKNGQPINSPSPHTRAAMEADAKAFTEVFGKDADEYFHAWPVARYIE